LGENIILRCIFFISNYFKLFIYIPNKNISVNIIMPTYKSRVADSEKPKRKRTTKKKTEEKMADEMRDDEIDEAEQDGGRIPTGGKIKLSDALAGVSGASAGLGTLVPITAPIALPISGATGIASGISKLFGRGFNPNLVDKLNPLIDKLSHKQMAHVVGGMLPGEFSILQGLAANMLKQPHPLEAMIRKQVGGYIPHPKGIYKQATRDIIRASSPLHLAGALEDEMEDMEKGEPVGGGLLDSIKHAMKKGSEYTKKYVPKAIHVGRQINSAVIRGLKLAEQIGEVIDRSGLLKSDNAALAKLAEGISAIQPYTDKAANVLGTVESVGKALGAVFG
jgi:hypothetical protein